MAVVIASDLAKDMAGDPLLRGVSFRLERRERMTLSGRNGSGKTTLLRMLAGETSVDGGELVFAKGTRVALHDQRPPRERDLSLRDYVLSGAKELLAIEERLAELEAAMAAGATDAATLDAYATAAGAARARRRLRLARGHQRDAARPRLPRRGPRPHARDVLRRRADARLAGAGAGRRPDLLLLDEPTNHLDIESLEWLEAHLQTLDAAVVLVAHDRWFLEAVGTSVLELEAGRARFFKGTWHAWRQEKAARELALGRAIERQQEEIARLERFVTRFRAGTRARQAQSRAKRLEKIERVTREPRDGKSLGFAFKPPERSGRVVFELEDADLRIGDRELLRDAELWLERGEHVSLIGPNGSGKTTLISALAGQRELDDGKLRRGHNVKLGVLSQHAEELDATAHRARGGPARDRPHAERGALAARPVPVLRRGGREAARRPVGRRAPAAVAGDPRALGRQRADPRRADEPPRPRVARGARGRAPGLPGRAAARSPTTARCSTRSARARSRSRTARCARTSAAGRSTCACARSARRTSAPPSGPSRRRGRSRPPRGERAVEEPAPPGRRLEKAIEAAEAALEALEDELADPAVWSSPDRAAKSTRRHERAKAAVERLYAQLESVAG